MTCFVVNQSSRAEKGVSNSVLLNVSKPSFLPFPSYWCLSHHHHVVENVLKLHWWKSRRYLTLVTLIFMPLQPSHPITPSGNSNNSFESDHTVSLESPAPYPPALAPSARRNNPPGNRARGCCEPHPRGLRFQILPRTLPARRGRRLALWGPLGGSSMGIDSAVQAGWRLGRRWFLVGWWPGRWLGTLSRGPAARPCRRHGSSGRCCRRSGSWRARKSGTSGGSRRCCYARHLAGMIRSDRARNPTGKSGVPTTGGMTRRGSS